MVSVIMPTYNRAELLERAINSFLNQDYKDAELIVLNNGSIDNTRDIMNKFNIKQLHLESNITVGSALNLLWSHAKGEFVCQLHDDDQFTKDSISLRVKLFEESTEVVYGGVILQNIAGNERRLSSGLQVDKDRIFTEEYINFTTMMWRNELKKKFMFNEDLKYYFDWLFKIKCLRECKVNYSPLPVMYYTIHKDQESILNRDVNEESLMREKL